jgi:hypothetical protein
MFFKKLDRNTIQPIVIRFQEGLLRKLGFKEAIVVRFANRNAIMGDPEVAYLSPTYSQT